MFDQEASEPVLDALPRRRRPGRRMAFATLLMAIGYLWAADLAVHGGGRYGLSWDGVYTINSTRVLLNAMMPSEPAAANTVPPRLSFFGTPQPHVSAEQREAQRRMQSEIGAVEVVAFTWQRIMWVLAAGLALVAILSWITPWGRFCHLLAALAILVVTACTLLAVRYLDIPDGSGKTIWPLSSQRYATMLQSLAELRTTNGGYVAPLPSGGGLGTQPLATKSYVAVAATLSAYAWLLLAVFARRRRAERLATSSEKAGAAPSEKVRILKK